MRINELAASLLAVITLVGCNWEPPRLNVYPVSGSLLVDGRPADQALVYFHRTDGGQTKPFAKVAADGTFRPGTYTATDGLPAGEYALTVQWPTVKVVEGEERLGPDQLAGRYSDPQKPVATIRVSAGENVIPPLDLKRR